MIAEKNWHVSLRCVPVGVRSSDLSTIEVGAMFIQSVDMPFTQLANAPGGTSVTRLL